MLPERESREGELRFSRRSPFKPIVKLCPKCLTPLERGSKLGGWLVPQDYVCSHCGYHGSVFIEKDLEFKQPGPDED